MKRRERCAASGWGVKASCCDGRGRMPCPTCGRSVRGRAARTGVVTIDDHTRRKDTNKRGWGW